MGYSGLVSSEYSSGNRIQRGAITKTGHAHLRRVIIESAWAYQYRPWIGGHLLKRQQGLDQEVKDIAWKAQWRLHKRYKKLAAADRRSSPLWVANCSASSGPSRSISSSSSLSHRRHPSRLPCGSLRSAWTGPGGDARRPLP